MRLVSVNVSLPREVPHGNGTVSTGIYKEPVPGRVRLRVTNLEGNGQADAENHGGIYKAVYAYPIEHYDFWRRGLGRSDFLFGQFGENFTVQGMLEQTTHVGDVFRVGDALVEVTQPRAPCFKLGIRMGSPEFPKRFLASGRVGFYLRVLRAGEVGAGDVIHRVRIGEGRLTVWEVSHLRFFDPGNLEGAKEAVRVPALAPGWRAVFEKRVGKTGIQIEASGRQAADTEGRGSGGMPPRP